MISNRNNSEAMRGSQAQSHQQINGARGATLSPDKPSEEHSDKNNKKTAAGEGSSSGSEGAVWPKFAIGLTNKEKEEDFLVFKGSKLPQRPKKRAKLIQRTLNVSIPPPPPPSSLRKIPFFFSFNFSMFFGCLRICLPRGYSWCLVSLCG